MELVPNPDILAGLGEKFRNKSKPMLIGFALETENLKENATKKLQQKGVDAIVSNLASDALEGDTTRVTIYMADGSSHETDSMAKTELADIVLNLI